MRRRSYLQRLATPLPQGEPALFALRRARADEARPPAVVASAAGAAGAAAAERAGRAGARTEAEAPAALKPPPKVAGGEAVAAGGVEAGGTKVDAAEPASAPAIPLRTSGGAEAASMMEPAFAAPPVETAPALAAPAGAAVAPVARTSSPPFSPSAATAPAIRALKLHESAGGSPGAAQPAARVQIGTIEVRVAAPQAAQPPVAARPAATPRMPGGPAGPLARGYAWRFGLAQR